MNDTTSSALNRSQPAPIRLAISTCPNDTFAFHAILENKIDLQGLEFDIQLLDIQQLNVGLMEGRFDVAKASFYAAACLSDRMAVLPSGSAIGFGVGPLLLASTPDSNPTVSTILPKAGLRRLETETTLTLCPGEWTTAAMLFRMFYRDAIKLGRTQIENRLFSEIMPALIAADADFGVCIHEGRFTWERQGLYLVEDLGTRWEQETGAPLPLGGILVRQALDHDLTRRIQSAIQKSIEYGLRHRQETLPTMRKHAQEMNDDVLFRHVDLYVNEWTVDLGEVGRNALEALSQKARECGMITPPTPTLQVWSGDAKK